jgi:hypothetical protein
MITEVTKVEDVSEFFSDLFQEGVNAHPDDDFNDYINYETKEATYTLEEAILRNSLMNKSFEICENADVDIYDIMMELHLKVSGLDRFIPLPSKNNLT